MKNHIAQLIGHSTLKALARPLAFLVIVLAPVSAIEAQDASMATATSEASTLSHGDKKFIKKVARASTNEVALSQLADGRALSSEVKSFAKMMITDHTQANTDLTALASSKGVDITKPVEEGNADEVSSLTSKSGADFDKKYSKLMLSAHKDAVELFQDEAANGKDPDVVAFAKKYVDTLVMHLDHAKTLEATVNP